MYSAFAMQATCSAVVSFDYCSYSNCCDLFLEKFIILKLDFQSLSSHYYDIQHFSFDILSQIIIQLLQFDLYVKDSEFLILSSNGGFFIQVLDLFVWFLNIYFLLNFCLYFISSFVIVSCPCF